MAKKIWVLEADQLPSETPRHNVKRAVADVLVRRLLARRIAKHLIQMLVVKSASQHPQSTPALMFIDGPFGIGNLLPFAKSQNPQMFPERLHYPIPACGDHRRSWANRFMAEPA